MNKKEGREKIAAPFFCVTNTNLRNNPLSIITAFFRLSSGKIKKYFCKKDIDKQKDCYTIECLELKKGRSLKKRERPFHKITRVS